METGVGQGGLFKWQLGGLSKMFGGLFFDPRIWDFYLVHLQADSLNAYFALWWFRSVAVRSIPTTAFSK